MLKISNLTLIKENKKILDSISLNFEDSKTYAIVGPNGAGKSSLSYAIMGLESCRNHEGQIYFNDTLLNPLSVTERAKLGITLAWQEPARFKGLKVKDYLLSSGKKDYVESLRRVGLDPDLYLNRALDHTLSGGERKRIEIASILMMDPRVVIFDEPDSGIDIEAIELIFSIISYLKKNATIILVTHSPSVLAKADHAYLLCDGRIVDEGPVNKINNYFTSKCITCRRPQ